MIQEYVHEKMDEVIDAISGHYLFHKEVRLPFNKREILYVVGCAVLDRSCCGPGGCGFAHVPGYIISWKTRVDSSGRDISEIEPISDRSIRQEVARFIQEREIVSQVQVW